MQCFFYCLQYPTTTSAPPTNKTAKQSRYQRLPNGDIVMKEVSVEKEVHVEEEGKAFAAVDGDMEEVHAEEEGGEASAAVEPVAMGGGGGRACVNLTLMLLSVLLTLLW